MPMGDQREIVLVFYLLLVMMMVNLLVKTFLKRVTSCTKFILQQEVIL